MATEVEAVKKRKIRNFGTILKSAACEWFLIIFLFLGAVFSYMLRKFAYYCELETPCPLCSMLDHIFMKKKPGSYWSLVCNFHKEEISSLVSIADVYGMCEECLMPTVKQSKSHKLISGKSWVDIYRTCSCCNKMWKAKPNGERLVEVNKVGLGASKANTKPPMPCVRQGRLRHRCRLKGLSGKFTSPNRAQQIGSNGVDCSSRVGHPKPKLSSYSESEDDDDGGGGGTVCSSCNNFMKSENDFGFSRSDIPQMAVNNVGLNELKNVCPSPIYETNEHCSRELSSAESDNHLAIKEKPIDNGGPLEDVHTSTTVCTEVATETSSGDACSSNSNSKNLTDSLRLSTENIEIHASDSQSLKRSESSYESLDGISVDEIENESIVDRLKRQVDHDRSCIKSLLKELEEERNAAAVAANETMAMITRLQEEKAKFKMEAMQYLRVVEEQTRYDMRALEKANDLLSERDKEMQDMEFEIECYRNNESELEIETSVLNNVARVNGEFTPTERSIIEA